MMAIASGPTASSDDHDLARLAKLGLMTAGVAHDLGNLLQVIGSALRLIDRNLAQPAGADLRRFCEGAFVALDHAAELRQQVLDLARPEGIIPTSVGVRSAIAAISNLILLTAGDSIDVRFVSRDDDVAVMCDERDLKSAILNLVANAKDAMPHGGRLTLAISSERIPGSDRFLSASEPPVAVLQISDTGCGMSADIVALAFDRFFTTRVGEGGTGFGLAMVQDFVRSVGGSAEVDSMPGVGTTVTLRLPAIRQ